MIFTKLHLLLHSCCIARCAPLPVFYRFKKINKCVTCFKIPACDLPIDAIPSAVPLKCHRDCMIADKELIAKEDAWTGAMFTYLASSVQYMHVCGKVSEKGIQFLVLADQVVVHLYICCFEVIHIWLIRGRTG